MKFSSSKPISRLANALDACDDLSSVALTLVQEGARLAGSELSVWNVKTHQLEHVAAVAWPDPGWDIAPLVPVLDTFMLDHPVTVHLRARNWRSSPVRLSSLVTERDYRNSGLYRDVYRHLETRFQVIVPLGVDLTTNTNLSFNRWTSDFSDHSLADLGELQTMAIRRLRKIKKVHGACLLMNQLSSLFRPVSQGVIRLATGHRIADADAAARQLLQTYFDFPARSTSLPLSLHQWVENSLTPPPLGKAVVLERFQLHQTVFEQVGRRLMVTLFRDNFQALPLLLLKDTTSNPPVTTDPGATLSTREKEVLTWVVEGKSNQECAQILGVSHRTIEKHCEHIYVKMGVENRSSAIRTILGAGIVGIRSGT